MICLGIQSTPETSNLQEKSKKVLVIGSSKEIAGSKGKRLFLLHSEHFNHSFKIACRNVK